MGGLDSRVVSTSMFYLLVRILAIFGLTFPVQVHHPQPGETPVEHVVFPRVS